MKVSAMQYHTDKKDWEDDKIVFALVGQEVNKSSVKIVKTTCINSFI